MSAGASCFWEADLLHKIFGVGPDCMYAFLSNEASPELQNMVYDSSMETASLMHIMNG